MNKKTLTVLISSIAGVLILAGVATLLVMNAIHQDKPANETASPVDSSLSSGQEDKSANTESDGTAASQSGKTDDKDTASGKTVSNGKTAITVKDLSAQKGKNIKVPVQLTDNPGIMAFLLEFTYDSGSLEYLGYQKADLYSEYEENATKGSVKMIIMADEDVKKDGDLVYLNFKVKDSAKSSTQIKVSDGKNDICNYNEQIVTCKTVNGTVTIK